MPMKPLTAAKLVCERSGWTISNLKLQKILYLAHMAYIGRNEGKPLIDGHFEAWDYGPVSPEVYKLVSCFGRDQIEDVFPECDDVDSEEKKQLFSLTDELLDFSAAELVGTTHWEGGAWAKNYVPDKKSVVIPFLDIVEEYKARVKFADEKEKAAS